MGGIHSACDVHAFHVLEGHGPVWITGTSVFTVPLPRTPTTLPCSFHM